MIHNPSEQRKLNEEMDALKKANEDVNILFNITEILTEQLRYHQIYTYVHTILAYLRNCLTYMRQVTTHVMDYIDVAMTNILSPDLLPVEKLRSILRNIESQLPSIMHLPISSDDTLHFYQYLKTHKLLANRKCLFLINIFIQELAQQLKIYKVFNLPVPLRNKSA